MKLAFGMILGMLLYIFIFAYGSMIMMSVIEEKTSRIMEIMISSVKPFQLMMGKILGTSLAGLTQFFSLDNLDNDVFISYVCYFWYRNIYTKQ